MDIASALQYSAGGEAVHESGLAQVALFEEFGFSLLTVDHATFVIQDLEGSTTINGVPHSPEYAEAFAERIGRQAGISWTTGWQPAPLRSSRCPGPTPPHRLSGLGKAHMIAAGLVGASIAMLCILHYATRRNLC